jgi:hypothetical protein
LPQCQLLLLQALLSPLGRCHLQLLSNLLLACLHRP